MKLKSQFGLTVLILAITQLGAFAQTTFFTDSFASSTTNGASVRSGTPTASVTSYDIAGTKNTIPGVTIAPNDLRLTLATSTTSGFMEAQAIFATNGHPVTLSTLGDYVNVVVVFTNTTGTLLAGGTQSYLWLGLFNSGNSTPVAGALAQAGLTTTTGSAYATGNCASWQGYISQIANSGTTRITTRPLQNGTGTSSANQELFGSNVGGGAFNNPSGTVISTAPVAALALTTGGTYTMQLTITLSGLNILGITNNLYSGVGTGGTLLFSQGGTNTSATYLTSVFDGLGIGIMNKGTSFNPVMDISSITVNGQSTAITTPPTITSQPVPVVVASNGACLFNVAAVGANVTYQWYRNNTLLANGGHISGATSPQLIISPATSADAFSGANGYYAVVTGTGPFSTNSVTNSLTVIQNTNLIWTAAGGATWDLNNTISWQDASANALPFNYGNSVLFDDTASSKFVTLSGTYLSPTSITVNSSATYTLTGSGVIAGPGSLAYIGTGQLTLNTASTFTGGTLVSNATPNTQYVLLQNYGGLGAGPLTLNSPGATMEIVNSGSGTLGIAGSINVQNDFTFLTDAAGTYATVFLGDLSGTAGKTLTINPFTTGTTNRYRAYGTNTIFNANLVLDGVDSAPLNNQAIYYGTVLAPYGSTGSQTYNGVISGVGGIVQRGAGTTYLNNQNTYAGGTVPTAGTIALGANSTPTTGTTITSGPIGSGALILAPEVNGTTSSGTVLAAGGARTLGNALVYPSGTNNLTLIVGGTNNLTFTAAFGLNGQDLLTTSTYPSRFFQIANTGSTTFAGIISDASSFFAFTKSGAGTLYLNAANTYTGNTTNLAGLLAGSGSVAGSVIVTTNASIGGGSASAPGTFGIGGNLILTNGGGFFRLNRSGTSDQVAVTGNVTNGGAGTITVTNLGTALQVGDSFAIFNKAVVGGATLAISGGGVSWTNKLAINGTIQVVPSVSLNPTNITSSVSGSVLTLTWPADHIGWRLQVQTNALTSGLNPSSNAWSTVTGSASVNTQTININPANGSVFYRLVYP